MSVHIYVYTYMYMYMCKAYSIAKVCDPIFGISLNKIQSSESLRFLGTIPSHTLSQQCYNLVTILATSDYMYMC